MKDELVNTKTPKGWRWDQSRGCKLAILFFNFVITFSYLLTMLTTQQPQLHNEVQAEPIG